MSLINRMLQDLEARGTEGTGTGTIHGQVRAVRERRRTRTGLWLALGVVAVLLVALALFWSRRSESDVTERVPHAAPPELSLRLAPELGIVPLSVPKILAPRNAGPVAAEPQVLASADVRKPAPSATANDQSKETVAATSLGKPTAVEAGGLTATAPLAALIVPAAQAPTKVGVPAATATLNDSGVPAVFSKQVKELTPQQRSENEYRKAGTLVQQGRTTEAINVLEQALLLDQQNSAARQTLVGVLLESKRQVEAIRKLQEGLGFDPNQPGLAMILARQLVDRGELRSAVEALQTTLPYGLERADYQAFLAALLQRQAKHKEAIEHYLSAVRMAPQSGVWWMGLGISLQAENRLADAQDAFNRAKASNSLSSDLQAFVEQRLRQMQQ